MTPSLPLWKDLLDLSREEDKTHITNTDLVPLLRLSAQLFYISFFVGLTPVQFEILEWVAVESLYVGSYDDVGLTS